jgi:hypothetical protein
MKVLVATRKTQGSREGDFSRTIEGELVFDAGPCTGVADDGEWDCECSIAFRGVATGELTTTAVVADLPMRLKEYQEAVCDGLALKGVCSDCALECARAAWKLAMRWPTGTVIERHQTRFAPRQRQQS